MLSKFRFWDHLKPFIQKRLLAFQASEIVDILIAVSELLLY